MKKFSIYLLAAVALMSASACQKEPIASVNDAPATVKLTLEVPEVAQTKAIAKAENADIVYFEVWNSDWTRKLTLNDANYPGPIYSETVDNKRAEIELTLVADQTYNFIFWAQNEASAVYDVTDLTQVKIDYSEIAKNGNNDAYDAYYATESITVDGVVNKTITLYRPFAQLNFGASNMSTSFGPIVVKDTEVAVTGLATTFDTINGVGKDESAQPVTFKANGLATTEKLETNGAEYTWVAMDYMLMMGKDDLVKVDASFKVEGMDAPVTHSLSNVPLEKNYRTNIIGDLFAVDAKLEIIIDPAFEKPDHIVGVGTIVNNTVSLQTSINKASDGEVLVLADGEYEGTFLIANKSLTLVAENPGQAVIKGKVGVAYKDVTFNGIAFEVSSATAAATSNSLVNKAGRYIIPIYCANVVVENCTFSGMTDDDGAIYYYANTNGATNENLEKLTVTDSKFVGERAIRSRANVEVTGCEFEGLLNPCLQVLGFGEGSLNGKVIFTDNTSDNVVNGVTIKTGNFVIANVDFNVGGNVNCNTIAYDTKKVSNMHQDTFTYSGEVTTIVVEQ